MFAGGLLAVLRATESRTYSLFFSRLSRGVIYPKLVSCPVVVLNSHLNRSSTLHSGLSLIVCAANVKHLHRLNRVGVVF